MELERRSGESKLQHHKRLIYGKLVDRTLADMDYSEIAEMVYGQPYSSDVARRMMYGSRRTLELMDEENLSAASDAGIMSEIEQKIIELRIERQKFYDQRAAFNKVIRERSRQEELNDILMDSIRNGNLVALDYTPGYVEASDNDLIVSLNDIHYGIDINNAWNVYNPDVCRQMMRKYLDEVLRIAEVHGSENCYVCNNGDSISGKIHTTIQIANKENVIDQVKGVSELIAGFLAELSPHFKTVRYTSVAGNHSRLDTKENAPIDERMDDLIEWYLAARLQDFENIEIGYGDKIDPTMYLLDVRGKTYCGVHGDFDGSPTKIAALQALARRQLYAVLCGHLHHLKIEEIQGVLTVMSGSFIGIDNHCIQMRLYSEPSQTVCVCDKDGIRCTYNVKLK